MTTTQLIVKLAQALYDKSDIAGCTSDDDVFVKIGKKAYEIKDIDTDEGVDIILGDSITIY